MRLIRKYMTKASMISLGFTVRYITMLSTNVISCDQRKTWTLQKNLVSQVETTIEECCRRYRR